MNIIFLYHIFLKVPGAVPTLVKVTNPPPTVSCKRPPPKIRATPPKKAKVPEETAGGASSCVDLGMEQQLESEKTTVQLLGLLLSVIL